RRRHTRSDRDWSSDVCSSDLAGALRDTSATSHGTYETTTALPTGRTERRTMSRTDGNGTAVMTTGGGDTMSRLSTSTSGSTTATATAKPARRPSARGGKRVYFFGKRKAEGTLEMKELLGGKGANLADMTRMGLPVPPGFTITTTTCAEYYDNGHKLPPRLMNEVKRNLSKVERATKKKFGNPKKPLLLSVRS